MSEFRARVPASFLASSSDSRCRKAADFIFAKLSPQRNRSIKPRQGRIKPLVHEQDPIDFVFVSTPTAEAPSVPEAPRPWLSRVAGALTHRNFRLVWFAALGSTIGTWMQKY